MSADDVIKAHVAALKAGTEKARALTQNILNVPYGEEDEEKLDVYMPISSSPDVPLVIYLHGGYWQFLSKDESGFMAVPLAQKGVVVVAVDYSIAPKGNMDLMVSQARRSLVAVIQQYSHISGLYLCGHSAGAHLVAMVLSTDWSEYSVSPHIKGAFLVSGIYDLLPILPTYVNEPLKMTEEVALSNSPSELVSQLKASSSGCVIVVAVAQNDSPEFRKQSEDYFKFKICGLGCCWIVFGIDGIKNGNSLLAAKNSGKDEPGPLNVFGIYLPLLFHSDTDAVKDFAESLQATGLKVTFEDIPDTDHFNIIEQLVDENYYLTQLLLKMMGKS